MENYLTPSNWTNTYAPAALQGIFVAIPSIPPFLFLLYVQLLKKEIFLTYKYTVFMTCYLCFINQSLKLFAYIGQYYAAIVQMQTNALGCFLLKSFWYYLFEFGQIHLLGLSLNRFLNIIFHIQPKVYWFLVIGLGVYLVQVAYLIISLIDAQLVYGNACNPMLGTNILDGAMFPLTWMFGYNTVTGILNLWLIIHLRLHYRKLKGKSVSLEQQKIQRNIQIGLLVSSIYPALQQAYTAVQVKMAYSQTPIPGFINVPMTVLTRTSAFLQLTTPWMFLRAFQDELFFLFMRRKISDLQMFKEKSSIALAIETNREKPTRSISNVTVSMYQNKY